MKVKVDTGIGLDNSNKGLDEIKIEEINYYTNEYLPGQVKEQYKFNQEVRPGRVTTGIQLLATGTNEFVIGYIPRNIEIAVLTGSNLIIGKATYINGVLTQHCLSETAGIDLVNIVSYGGGLVGVLSIIKDGFEIENDVSSAITWTTYE